MRQVFALFVAVAFTLGLAGAALAQGTTQPAPPSSSPASPERPATDTSKSPMTTSPSGSQGEPSKSPNPLSGNTGTGADTGKTGKAGTTGTTDKSAAGSKAAPKAAGTAMRGSHKMVGEVTKIDEAKGMVTLKTDEGELDLHFPPAALKGVKEGDRVEIQLSMRPAAAAGAGAKTGASSGAKAPAAGAKTPAPSGSKAPSGAAPSSSTPEQPKTQ